MKLLHEQKDASAVVIKALSMWPMDEGLLAAYDEVLLRATGCCRPDEQSSLAAAAAARVRGAAANYTLPFVPP